MLTIEGLIHKWEVRGVDGEEHLREYLMVTLPFREAFQYFQPDYFDITQERGEQRKQVASHLAKLRKELREGNFTPTPWAAGLRDSHRKGVKTRSTSSGVHVCLTISPQDPIPLTDGGHRRVIFAEAVKEGRIDDKSPIEIILFVNGSTRGDFINLQMGKAVDNYHLQSLRIMAGLIPVKDKKTHEICLKIARSLNQKPSSRFYKKIKFDVSQSVKIKFSSLMTKSNSDAATSLVGLAKVGLHFDQNPDYLTGLVDRVVDYLAEQNEELVAEGKVLAAPPDHTAGSVTMLIGLVTLVNFRAAACGREVDTEDLDEMYTLASEMLDHELSGQLGVIQRRKLIGEVAREYFAPLDLPKHDGIPTELLEIFVPSAFACGPVPKESKE